ncbi:unnamed protein product [Kuraishia capsulata CBS 1993]|uniref:Uncharacterized protein n=1 Tax=Kuraishia capsulata CBS 1993 TaxID=1382522 RepID=W6MMF8_9ASCO|nr:uncharacterized protein KUCA_T00002073001 [Kuraishia capsulata CBS 1993]CDK26102.1 unnamed protein product [Kuraishia capsulata CBS 1993]
MSDGPQILYLITIIRFKDLQLSTIGICIFINQSTSL